MVRLTTHLDSEKNPSRVQEAPNRPTAKWREAEKGLDDLPAKPRVLTRVAGKQEARVILQWLNYELSGRRPRRPNPIRGTIVLHGMDWFRKLAELFAESLLSDTNGIAIHMDLEAIVPTLAQGAKGSVAKEERPPVGFRPVALLAKPQIGIGPDLPPGLLTKEIDLGEVNIPVSEGMDANGQSITNRTRMCPTAPTLPRANCLRCNMAPEFIDNPAFVDRIFEKFYSGRRIPKPLPVDDWQAVCSNRSRGARRSEILTGPSRRHLEWLLGRGPTPNPVQWLTLSSPDRRKMVKSLVLPRWAIQVGYTLGEIALLEVKSLPDLAGTALAIGLKVGRALAHS
jgi:hypothetical protein